MFQSALVRHTILLPHGIGRGCRRDEASQSSWPKTLQTLLQTECSFVDLSPLVDGGRVLGTLNERF